MVAFSFISIAVNLVMIGLIYKNYKNSRLSPYASNVGFNLLIDNFVMRPIMSILIAIPLSRLEVANSLITRVER